jgi:signal transduction histidine kinase
MLTADLRTLHEDEASILLVDDRQENLDVLEALLAQPQLHLIKAASGEAALEALLERDVALALIDVRMPGMDGFELAELMRGSERTRHVPIIFVTASAPETGRIFRGYEAGAVDFLFKPIDPQLLQSKVGVFIELFRQRQQLARQVEEHQKLVQTAELLIGVLSHDLRGPLSVIVTAGEFLDKAYADDEQIERISQRIRGASSRMTRLIQQLLTFAAARMGRLPIATRDVDLAELCQTAVNDFMTEQDALEWRVEGNARGMWDPDRLLQVLSNLIRNALQHGDRSRPVTIAVDGRQPDTVCVMVSNGGEISEAVRHNLFAPFVTSREEGGTGLGLFIVDQIARAHGGQMSVSSAEGVTAFTLTLPRGQA